MEQNKRIIWALGNAIAGIKDAVHILETMQKELIDAELAEERATRDYEEYWKKCFRMYFERLAAASD